MYADIFRSGHNGTGVYRRRKRSPAPRRRKCRRQPEKKPLPDINAFSPLPDDVVVGISASGNPAYVLTVLEEARCRGANTVGITCNPEAKLKPLCDVCITAPVGPEVIAGSSRMKAGTAQKMILNMLSTASMIKIGKTYGNYMIDVTLPAPN